MILELRVILLIVGALFVLGVVIFEIRRSRRNRPLNKVMNETPPEAPRMREPTISLPEIHVRHPSTPLPSIEMSDADSMVGLRLDTTLDTSMEPSFEEAGAPMVAASEHETIEATAAFPAMVPLAPLTPESTLGVVSTAHSSDLAPDEAGRAEEIPEPFAPPSAEPPPPPIVDWPPESTRRIYSMRLMSNPERFPGRNLRLALADEGFVHGEFNIYHKPASDNRVVVSASSLTKPGTFDPATIDVQRFLGLSLFVVLPGPLPARAAIDEMARTAGELALRLDGSLQDDHGRPVTPEIIASLRETAARESTP